MYARLPNDSSRIASENDIGPRSTRSSTRVSHPVNASAFFRATAVIAATRAAHPTNPTARVKSQRRKAPGGRRRQPATNGAHVAAAPRAAAQRRASSSESWRGGVPASPAPPYPAPPGGELRHDEIHGEDPHPPPRGRGSLPTPAGPEPPPARGP